MLHRSRVALVLASSLATACSTEVHRDDVGGGGGPAGIGAATVACDGATTTVPRRLASGVAAGALHVVGDRLVLAERQGGRVLAVDPCSGDVLWVAEAGPTRGPVVVVGDVPLTTLDDPPRLVRVDPDSGALTTVATLEAAVRLVSDGVSIHGWRELALDASDEPDAVPDVGFYRVDPASGALTLVHRAEAWAPGTSTHVVGASSAGVYFRQSYDCGCNPRLQLIPAAGGDIVGVASSEGAMRLAVVGDRLIAAVDLESVGFGEVDLDVVSLPLTGGEPTVLHAKDGETTVDAVGIAADADAVCWGSRRGPVRCMAHEPGAEVRALGDEDDPSAASELALIGGAVVWLATPAEAELADLWTAVP